MSIIVLGMKMPIACSLCPMCTKICPECRGPTRPRCRAHSFKGRLLNREKMWIDREKWCSLVELPPHGRLIDADAMIRELEKWSSYPVPYIQKRNLEFIHFLKEAETVIEAEGDNDTDP